MLIDSHCHLDKLDLAEFDGNLEKALSLARERGVQGFLCVGIELEELPGMMKTIDKLDGVYASAGHHPLADGDYVVDEQTLLGWVNREDIVAVGETGLDYYYGSNRATEQLRNFEMHLQVARRVGKPVIVHSREAAADTLRLLSRYSSEAGGVMHCFTDTWDTASKAMDQNFYISFSGIVTFANASNLREVVKKVPLDRMLVETDAPYLAPVPHRGRQNQPAYVRDVAEFVANLKGIAYEELAQVTTSNFRRLFLQG